MPTRKGRTPRNLTRIVRAFKAKRSQLKRITVIECFDVEKKEEITERHQFYDRALRNIPMFDYFSFSADDDNKTNVGISHHCTRPHYYTNVEKIRAYLEGLTESRIIYIIGHGSPTPAFEVMRYDDRDVCSAIMLKQQNPKGTSVICYGTRMNADPRFFLELSKLNLRVPQLFILEMCYSGKFVPPKFQFPRTSNLQLVFAKDREKQDLNGSTIKDYAFNQRGNEYFNSFIRPDGTKHPRYMRIDPSVILKRISARDDKMDIDSNDSNETEYNYSSVTESNNMSDSSTRGGKKSTYARRLKTKRALTSHQLGNGNVF